MKSVFGLICRLRVRACHGAAAHQLQVLLRNLSVPHRRFELPSVHFRVLEISEDLAARTFAATSIGGLFMVVVSPDSQSIGMIHQRTDWSLAKWTSGVKSQQSWHDSLRALVARIAELANGGSPQGAPCT